MVQAIYFWYLFTSSASSSRFIAFHGHQSNVNLVATHWSLVNYFYFYLINQSTKKNPDIQAFSALVYKLL